MCVCLYLGIGTWVHVPRGSWEPLDMGANNQTQVLCKGSHMLFTPEQFIHFFWDRISYLTWSSLIHLGWLTNELWGSFCLWYSPLLASVSGFLCRFWGSELRSSCLCTCEAGILTEPFSHPVLRIFWDRISWWVWSLPNKHFTYQTIALANRFCSFCSAKDGFMALHIACKGYTSGSPSELLAF